MIALDFLSRFRRFPAFSLRQVELAYPGFDRDNLLNWQKKGYIIRIRNGWYSVKGCISSEQHLYWASNKIYAPSYISLETALSYYGWIPEAVFTMTSVTTRKTTTFDTPVGQFRYSSIKPSLFFGYRIVYFEGLGTRIAEPEKTLLDFLYLNPQVTTVDDFESYRFRLDLMREQIDRETLANYCILFDSRALSERVRTFTKYLYHD